MRTGKDHRLTARQPDNDDVEKAPADRAEGHGKDGDQPSRHELNS
jgi:hypothetical protein